MSSQPPSVVEPRPVLAELSVVIPTLGRPILQDCLGWIAAGSAWPACVIVVDQGGVPQPPAWLGPLRAAGFSVNYVMSSQRGKSAGINRAFERVTTRFVAVTDDDCFAEADWLGNMLAALLERPDGIVTGRVTAAGEGEEFCVVTSMEPRVYSRPQLRAHPLSGGNMGVSMANVQRIGPFDEDPVLRAAAEDSDWGYRALRLGIPIMYRPEIVVRHYNWRSDDQRADRYGDYSRSQGAFYGKHLLGGGALIPLQICRGLIRAPIRWVRGVVRGDADMAARGKADTLGLLPGVLAGLKARRRS